MGEGGGQRACLYTNTPIRSVHLSFARREFDGRVAWEVRPLRCIRRRAIEPRRDRGFWESKGEFQPTMSRGFLPHSQPRALRHTTPHAAWPYLLTYPPGRTDKKLCRCFGAPARRVFPIT